MAIYPATGPVKVYARSWDCWNSTKLPVEISICPEQQAMLGSPPYMAPEQWDRGAITPATDQFGFAVLAYCMITGSRPFDGQDSPEIRAKNFRRGPIPAHDEAAQNGRQAVQPAVSDVLRRALSTSPAERYASVEQFTRALSKALVTGRRSSEAPLVFVSYDRELSGGWARYFSDKLKDKHGIGVYMDTAGLDRARRFPQRLTNAIEDCDVFVCFLAGSTLKSKWVNEEVRLAHQYRKLMIPIFQESYVEPVFEDDGDSAVRELISHQGVKLFDVSGHYVDNAVAALARMVKGRVDVD